MNFRRRHTPPTGEYIPAPLAGTGISLLEHLDGVDWFTAPPPPRRHQCWAQTRGISSGSYVRRCACGAISMDTPPEIKAGREYWMERNQRTREEP